MKIKIIASIMLIILSISIFGCAYTSERQYSKEELNILINDAQNIKDHAHNMAESARVLGWENDDDLIKELSDRWFAADEEQKAYQAQLDNILAKEQAEEDKWKTKAAEYPVATQIWRYMKALGWNDYVCAGVMGNIMAEVGGQTLNIQPYLSGNGYYGMCQWNRAYGSVWGADLQGQCNFLRDTIKYEIDTYGSKYQKGFNFNSFLNLTDARAAALAFAKSYERCGSASYTVRQNNAIKAYNYFVN